MKIAVFTRYDEHGASSRVRAYAYAPALAEQGITCEFFPLLDKSYLARVYSQKRTHWPSLLSAGAHRLLQIMGSGRFDLIWIEYELFPYMPALAERLLSTAGRRYVVDYDDAIFHNYDSSNRLVVRALLGSKIDVVMRNAAAVLVANEYLADRAQAAGARQIVRIPTVVDLAHWGRPLQVPSQGPFRIGWIGTPITVKYLSLLRGPLRQLASRRPVELRLIGTTQSPIDAVAAGDLTVTYVPWSRETEASELAKIDVGIMPLPDQPWTRGKSAYKLLQCMAAGKPVVASPVGMNTAVIEPGRNGFLAKTAGEWLSALEQLSADPALRARMGNEGRAMVAADYTYEQTVPRLAETLRLAAKPRGASVAQRFWRIL